jgi:hypothetical protein
MKWEPRLARYGAVAPAEKASGARWDVRGEIWNDLVILSYADHEQSNLDRGCLALYLAEYGNTLKGKQATMPARKSLRSLVTNAFGRHEVSRQQPQPLWNLLLLTDDDILVTRSIRFRVNLRMTPKQGGCERKGCDMTWETALIQCMYRRSY